MKHLRKFYDYLHSLNGNVLNQEDFSRLEKRLQMIIALTFFAPTVTSSLGSNTLQENNTALAWYLIVAVYLIIYLVVDGSKGKIKEFRGRILNYGIWFNLMAFIPYLLFLAVYGDSLISGFPLITLFLTIITVFWSPFLILVLLAFEFMLGEFFSFIDTVKHGT